MKMAALRDATLTLGKLAQDAGEGTPQYFRLGGAALTTTLAVLDAGSSRAAVAYRAEHNKLLSRGLPGATILRNPEGEPSRVRNWPWIHETIRRLRLGHLAPGTDTTC